MQKQIKSHPRITILILFLIALLQQFSLEGTGLIGHGQDSLEKKKHIERSMIGCNCSLYL